MDSSEIASVSAPREGFVARLTGGISPRGRVIAARGLGVMGAAAIMPLAVILPEKLAPHQMAHLTDYLAQHLVAPHLSHIMPAYDCYKRNTSSKAHYAEWKDASPEQKAHEIASGMVSGALMLGVGTAADIAGTKAAEKLLNAHIPQKMMLKTQGIDQAVSLGSIVVLNTALGHTSREARHDVSHMLTKKLGMSHHKAKEIAETVSATAGDAVGALAGMTYLASKVAGHGI